MPVVALCHHCWFRRKRLIDQVERPALPGVAAKALVLRQRLDAGRTGRLARRSRGIDRRTGSPFGSPFPAAAAICPARRKMDRPVRIGEGERRRRKARRRIDPSWREAAGRRSSADRSQRARWALSSRASKPSRIAGRLRAAARAVKTVPKLAADRSSPGSTRTVAIPQNQPIYSIARLAMLAPMLVSPRGCLIQRSAVP